MPSQSMADQWQKVMPRQLIDPGKKWLNIAAAVYGEVNKANRVLFVLHKLQCVRNCDAFVKGIVGSAIKKSTL